MMLSVLTSSVLVSCSKDDETKKNDKTKKDPIIGEWYYYSLRGKEVSDCEKKSKIVFFEDYTATELSVFDDSNGDCKKEKPFKTKWEKVKEGKYLISSRSDIVLSLRNKNTELIGYGDDGEEFICKKK